MALHPYIMDAGALGECFGQVKSIASREECDFQHTRIELYPRRLQNKEEPRFAHIDMSVSRDSCGLAVAHVAGFKEIQRGSEIEILPLIVFDLILEIRPPRGGEIEFENVRRILYALRTIGMKLKWVTMDTYQSKDNQQVLARQGFMTGVQSMDVDTLAYDVCKQAIYDRRVLAPDHPKAQMEWARLERDVKLKKVDHPPKGSKDCSDAMAGAAYGITMRREVWVKNGIPVSRIPTSLLNKETTGKASVSYIEQLRRGRVEEHIHA
jgi:hypothetical protein